MSAPSTALNLCVTPYTDWVFDQLKAQGSNSDVCKTRWIILQSVPIYYACTAVKQNAGTISQVDKNKKAVRLYGDYAVDSFFEWVVATAKQDLPMWASHELFGKTNEKRE